LGRRTFILEFQNCKRFCTQKETSSKQNKQEIIATVEPISALTEDTFNIYDFIPPISAKLIELGIETESSSAAKGTKFEKAVCEVFR